MNRKRNRFENYLLKHPVVDKIFNYILISILLVFVWMVVSVSCEREEERMKIEDARNQVLIDAQNAPIHVGN